MSDNRDSCPRCGAEAELPDGTFNISDDTIEVLSAPDLTHERLARLKAILDEASAGSISDEAATAAIVEIEPDLAPLVAKYGPPMSKAFIFFLRAVLSALIAIGVSAPLDHSATKADVQKAVEQAVRECQK